MPQTPELEEWEFGDPLEVVERRRGEQCCGCAHAVRRTAPLGHEIMICRKGRKYGTRCHKFKDETE